MEDQRLSKSLIFVSQEEWLTSSNLKEEIGGGGVAFKYVIFICYTF